MTSLAGRGGPAEGIDCFRKRAGARVRARVRAPPADRHAERGWRASTRSQARAAPESMRLRPHDFPDRLCDPPVELARGRGPGFDSLFFPEHTHIPVSRETPYPAAASCRDAVLPPARSVRRAPAVAPVDRADRSAPASAWSRARSDRAGEGGRPRRPSVGRTLRVRHRRRLEPRGDANHGTDPRRRCGLMRERVARDEGDLDAGRGRRTTASSSTSSRSGRSRSRCRSRTRRCWSAATATTVLDRVLEYGDGGCRTGGAGDLGPGSPSCASAAAATGRRHLLRRQGTTSWTGSRRPAWIACCCRCPAAAADEVLPLVERYAELAARHR